LGDAIAGAGLGGLEDAGATEVEGNRDVVERVESLRVDDRFAGGAAADPVGWVWPVAVALIVEVGVPGQKPSRAALCCVPHSPSNRPSGTPGVTRAPPR
jgi:hypothetical protein